MKISKTVVFALFFLLVGGLRPTYAFVSSLSESRSAMTSLPAEDFGDGEEEQDSSDTDDDAPKVLASKLMLQRSSSIANCAATFYQDIFGEHHPQVITPPPKG